MKKLISFFALLIVLSALLPSCGPKLTDEQAIEIVAPLLDASYEINDIFFGEGLPHKSLEEEESGIQYDVKPVKYVPVESEDYKGIEDLKAAARAVYTESYLDAVFSIAFEGIMGDDGAVYQYARYIDTLTGGFSIKSGVENDSIVAGRRYDVNSLKITKQGNNYVFFTLTSYIDGVQEENPVTLSIKDEGNGWRLDSPTY